MVSSSVRQVLRNQREGRLRTPWRLFVGAAVVFAAGVCGVLLASVVGFLTADADTAGTAVAGTGSWVGIYGAVAVGVLVAVRLVDRRTLRDVGLSGSRAWWADLGFGLAVGVGLPAVVFLTSVALDLVRVTGTFVARSGTVMPPATGLSFPAAVLATVVYFIAVGAVEELLVRGYLLTNLSEGLCWFPGVGERAAIAAATGVTSAVFGLGHIANPNATPVAAVTITAFGVFLAAGYLLTGRIAVPIGVHIAWNLALSSLFGFPVSGVRTPVTVVAVETTGPDLMTGGAFGPEAGIVAIAPLLVGSLALVGWVRWREGTIAIHESIAVSEIRRDDVQAGR
jgi:membrane protease YdiL (CAAX protease family)